MKDEDSMSTSNYERTCQLENCTIYPRGIMHRQDPLNFQDVNAIPVIAQNALVSKAECVREQNNN